jgi:hypothetical protein
MPNVTADAPKPSSIRPRRRIRWRRVIAVTLVVLLVVAVVGVIWFSIPQQVLPEADAALVSTPDVTVTQSDGTLTFAPTEGAETGFIFYPGAKVPPSGYAVPARAVAERGYLVVVPSMPLNFAVLNPDAATVVIAEHPEISAWAIGGHSLGGAMAGQFVASHPGAVEGLVLWAAYTAADTSGSGVAATVVYGSLDSGADRNSSAESLALLPADATVERIEGGNHANFGSYTGQPNDPPATISREEQQARAVTETVALLEAISAPD